MNAADQNPQVVFLIDSAVEVLMQEGLSRQAAIVDAILYLRRIKNQPPTSSAKTIMNNS